MDLISYQNSCTDLWLPMWEHLGHVLESRHPSNSEHQLFIAFYVFKNVHSGRTQTLKSNCLQKPRGGLLQEKIIRLNIERLNKFHYLHTCVTSSAMCKNAYSRQNAYDIIHRRIYHMPRCSHIGSHGDNDTICVLLLTEKSQNIPQTCNTNRSRCFLCLSERPQWKTSHNWTLIASNFQEPRGELQKPKIGWEFNTLRDAQTSSTNLHYLRHIVRNVQTFQLLLRLHRHGLTNHRPLHEPHALLRPNCLQLHSGHLRFQTHHPSAPIPASCSLQRNRCNQGTASHNCALRLHDGRHRYATLHTSSRTRRKSERKRWQNSSLRVFGVWVSRGEILGDR